jgi:nucleotide-binding universal stress UspA family protein
MWATDGSSEADQAIPFLKSLAQAYSAPLIVVHVDEFPGPGGLGGVEDEVQAAIRNQMEDLKQEGLDATLQLADATAGGAAHVIAEIADKEGADLIVVGTRGRGPPSPGCYSAVSRIACFTS